MDPTTRCKDPERVPSSITQRVRDELRDQIVSGSIEPGMRLKVEDLKRQLNVGTAPIREALSLLTSDQLVERLDQRGFRVAEATAAHFNDLLALRCLLEERAIQDSIRHADDDWEVLVRQAYADWASADPAAPQRRERLHKQFHMSLLAACGSPMLFGLCNQLYDQNIRYRFIAGRSAQYAARNVDDEHAQILASALDRDAEFTAALLLKHYRRTGIFVAETLMRREGDDRA